MTFRAMNANNTLDIDERMKNHVINTKAEARQKLGFYYLRASQKEPVLMHVQTGDKVQKGDPLFTYIDERLNNDETEVELQLDNRRVAKEQVRGQIAAYEDKKLTAAARDTATINAQLNWLDSELTKAENNIDILKERQKRIVKQIDDLTVKAGADGTVLSVNEEQLQSFTSSSQYKPVVTLSMDALYIDGTANRYDMQFLEPNMKLKVTSSAVKGETFKGQLETISKTPVEHLAEGNLPVAASQPETEQPTTEQPETKKPEASEFQYSGFLNKADHLVDGDPLHVKVYPSYKNHIWLPERFVMKDVVTKEKDKKLKKPVTKYYVQKVYGKETNNELVVIKAHLGGQYLVTKGLSSIDKIKAFQD
ncbi:HlyD family efflux transporter periplasmic adaptor subunit [Macrococcus equipercicus]|nr:HlyD family efflux transporter periplasmic adaptor subunit [Macrococcus equipercicus]UTH14158.1 HlyD family efflux transporter periplasmic adaptor subunit [Macrococcus equipercicus]